MASVYYKYPYLRNDRLLKQIDETRTQTTYIRVTLLDWQENEMEYIEGEITGGNLNIDGSSAVRRTGSISFVATNAENNYNDLSFKYSLNKKIKIAFGLDNIIAPEEYPIKDFPIFWFPQGVFFITGCSFSHSSAGITVDIKFTDKMALLNGVVGGILPASVEFDKMETYDEDAKQVVIETPTMYQNIREIVNHWGNEQLGKILIGDLPNITRKVVTFDQSHLNIGAVNALTVKTPDPTTVTNPWKRDNFLWIDLNELSDNKDLYVPSVCVATLSDAQRYGGGAPTDTWKRYSQGCAIGYQYTTFTYPGELTATAGTALTTILDKIKEALGNYEYFYDIDGNFRFQEIKNYLNTSQSSEILSQLDQDTRKNKTNIGQITDTTYYYLDVATGKKQNFAIDRTKGGKGEIAYDFSNSPLIISYSNNPNYDNIKNDFIVWGERKTADGTKYPIRYHVAIDEKPRLTNTYVYSNIELPSYIKPVTNSDGENDYKLEASNTQIENYENLYGSALYKLTGRKDVYGRFAVDCSMITDDSHFLKQYNQDGTLLSITSVYGVVVDSKDLITLKYTHEIYKIYIGEGETRQTSPPSDHMMITSKHDMQITSNICLIFKTEWIPDNATYYHCDIYSNINSGSIFEYLPRRYCNDAVSILPHLAKDISFEISTVNSMYFKFNPSMAPYNYLQQDYNYCIVHDRPIDRPTPDPLVLEGERGPSTIGDTSEDPNNIIVPAEDWRTELLAQGYLAEKNGTDPGYYFPELSVEWPKIYDICHNHFYDLYQDHDTDNPSMVDKENGSYLITAPEPLDYFLDFIDVSSDIGKYSVNNIGRRTQVLVDNSINCIFEPPTPDLIFLSTSRLSGWPLANQITTKVGESSELIANTCGIINTSTTMEAIVPMALQVDISPWYKATPSGEPEWQPQIVSLPFPVIVYYESPNPSLSGGVSVTFQASGIFQWNRYIPPDENEQWQGETSTRESIWDSIFQCFMANNPINSNEYPVEYGGVVFSNPFPDVPGSEPDAKAQLEIRYYQVLCRICKALQSVEHQWDDQGHNEYMYINSGVNSGTPMQVTIALREAFQEMLKAQKQVADDLVEAYERKDHYTIIDNSHTSISTANAPNGADVAMKDLLYQYTNYKETISLTTIPIYHLEPNTLIKVRDYATGMNDTYVINSMSVSFNTGSTMTINATKAMTKI